MAYETYAPAGDAPVFQHPGDHEKHSTGNSLGALTNFAAAAMSVGLVIGVGVWSYKLMMRDVTGIPIVRAMEGEMRVRPDDPGGQLALHQGLAVNAVASDGGAEAPADRLVLAPQPVALTEEDVPIDDDAVAIVQQAIADQKVVMEDAVDAAEDTLKVDAAKIAAAAEAGSVENLVAALTDGVAPLENASVDTGPEVLVQAALVAPVTNALADTPGVKTSLRPQLRPKRTAPAKVENVVATAASATPRDIDAAALPAGTRLVQLGAYDTEDMARKEWAIFQARFGDLMASKDRVLQEAQSGGRTFYRLRAMGFDDLADARRFCSALVAEGADCIPVVTR